MWLLQNVFKYVVCAWLPFSEFRLLLKCRKWLIWESEQNKLHKKSLKSTFSITKQLEKHFFDYKKSLKSTFSITKIFSIIKHVSTALHVFDHTIKPIQLYDCVVWGSFITSSTRFRNNPIALDEIYSKSLCKKNHITSLVYLFLRVNCKSTKFAVLSNSEPDKHPMSFSIVQPILILFALARLENLDDDDTFP